MAICTDKECPSKNSCYNFYQNIPVSENLMNASVNYASKRDGRIKCEHFVQFENRTNILHG